MEWLETAGRILPFWVANPVRGAAAVAGVVFLIWSVWPLLTKNADVAKPAASPLPSATDARVSNTGTISGSVVVGGDVRGDIKVQQAPPSRTVKADESSPLELRVYGVPSDGPYPAGTMIAGIRWGDHLTDTRVELVNRTDETIVDLGLSIQLDTHIAAVGQLTQIPDVIIEPDQGPARFLSLMGTDEEGRKITMPIVPAGPMIAPVYRVSCPRVLARSSIQLVVAGIALNPPKEDGSMPDTLVAPVTCPTRIRLEGRYIVAPPGRAVVTYVISQELPVDFGGG